jgi:hypothetical protein
MWSTEAVAMTSGPPTAAWRIWADVAHWPDWNPLIARSQLDGQFVTGTRGVTKPQGGPESPFLLTEVLPEQRWVNQSRLPLASIAFIHELLPAPSGTQILMRAEIAGPLAALYGMLFGRNIRQGLPLAVQNLARLADDVAAPARATG